MTGIRKICCFCGQELFIRIFPDGAWNVFYAEGHEIRRISEPYICPGCARNIRLED